MRGHAIVLLVMGCLTSSTLAAADKVKKIQGKSFLLEEAYNREDSAVPTAALPAASID